MTQASKYPKIIKGAASHYRTEDDYMSVFLETVTLEDWKEVVSCALRGAKVGNEQARAWLSHYLVGKPQGTAPTPLTVVVQQLSGENSVVKKLAKPIINEHTYPSLYLKSDTEKQIKAQVMEDIALSVKSDL
jgi:hypothetical protein